VGYDQSYTNEALDLIPGNIAKTIVERNGRAIIGTARASDPDRGVNGAIDAEVPLAQIGSEGEIFFADMNSSMAVKRFPGGGKVNPGGVCNQVDQVNFFEWTDLALSWIDKQTVGNLALFAVYGADEGMGGVYSYGRKTKNDPFVLNLEYQLDADELGAVEVVDGTVLVSYQNGSTFGVKASDPNHKATWIYEGLDFKAPIKQPGQITTWKYAEIFCDPLVSGTSLEFWYRANKNGEFIQANMTEGVLQFTPSGEQIAVFDLGVAAEIFEPRVVGNPSGNYTPEVHRLRMYFE
jgi:hypothetical protein